MIRARDINLHRPRLTREQIEALEIGDRVRDIPGNPYEIIGFCDGKGDDSLVVMAWWHSRNKYWAYRVCSSFEMEARFTPHSLA
jgi:hypothetical protein